MERATGGFECEFVDPIPESLFCPVCLLPFRDPHLLDCCGAKYCAECIGRVKASSHGQPRCPICKQRFNTLLDKNDQRKVLGLKVRCLKKKEGCKWEGELRHLNDHRENCDHTLVKCRFGCGGRIPRHSLAEHEQDECPQRPVDMKLIRKMEQRHMAEIATLRKEFKSEMEKKDRAHKEEMKLLEQSVNKCLSAQEKRIQDTIKYATEIKEWFTREMETQHRDAHTAAEIKQQNEPAEPEGKHSLLISPPSDPGISGASCHLGQPFPTNKTTGFMFGANQSSRVTESAEFSTIPLLNFSTNKQFNFSFGAEQHKPIANSTCSTKVSFRKKTRK